MKRFVIEKDIQSSQQNGKFAQTIFAELFIHRDLKSKQIRASWASSKATRQI